MKIKFGSLVTAGSGKIGGHVAAKNRGGAYLRTKATPLNPNTSAQAGARSLLASLSTGWSTLTDDQRLAWNNAVANFATTDIFGDLRNPSGINLYVKLNSNLSNSGQALLTSPPEKVEIPFSKLLNADIEISAGLLNFTFADNGLSSQICKIQATPVMSNGVSFVKSQLRSIANVVPQDSAPDNYIAYTSKFGVPTVGGNVVFSITPITATGQMGIAQQIKATIMQ
jgi:hypothetical protein